MIINESVLRKVKSRLGVYYSTPEKDAEVSQIIGEAFAFMLNAGWYGELVDDDLTIGAIVIYAKMAQQIEPNAMLHNPIFINMILQSRNKVVSA